MSSAAESESRPDSLQTIIEADRFQQVVEILRSVDDECIYNLGRNGLDVSLIEPSQAYMVALDASPAAFEHVGDGNYAIGANLERLDDLLGKAGADDLVQFVLDLESRKFAIEFDNIDYEMAGIDPNTVREEPDMPENEYPVEFDVEAKHLQRAEDICSLVSDHADIISDPGAECIRFEASGDIDDTDVTLADELEWAHSEHEDPVSSCLSIGDGNTGAGTSPGFLNDALDVIPADATVRCSLGDDMPFIMEWATADGDIEISQLIAPRLRKD